MIRLSELEERILDALWKEGKAFPKVLIAKMQPPVPPYNTVLSAIRKLERQGYVGYEKYGKSHQYYPILEKKEYAGSLLKKAFGELFGRSPETLVSYFSKEEDLDLKELEDAIAKIRKDELSD